MEKSGNGEKKFLTIATTIAITNLTTTQTDGNEQMTNLAAQIETATDNNEHTEATMIAARALNNTLGNAYLVILQEIADTHELNGHITPDHRTLRDTIQREIFTTLKLQGKM